MKIPSSIKIGPFVFAIEEILLLAELGEADVAAKKIVIKKDLDQQTRECTLVHEIFEAINGVYSLDLSHEAITILEVAWYQILKDNDFLRK